jgi:hypothetical protein
LVVCDVGAQLETVMSQRKSARKVPGGIKNKRKGDKEYI